MDGPEWAAGKLSEDHKDNRWSLLSADLRELEQQLANQHRRIQLLESEIGCAAIALSLMEQRQDLLDKVCEQCILEHQGRSI